MRIRLRSLFSIAKALAPGLGVLICGELFTALGARNFPNGPAPDIVVDCNQQAAQFLEYGKPIERVMAGGETHRYKIKLTAREFIHIVVEQHGIDVVVTLFAPDGRKIVEVDTPNGAEGPEPIWAVAEKLGEYELEIRLPQTIVTHGRYEARIETQHTASKQDLDYLDGRQALSEANVLREARDVAKLKLAVRKYEEVLKLWQTSASAEDIAVVRLVMGQTYRELRDPQAALRCFYQAESSLRSLGKMSFLAATLNEIGVVQKDLLDNPTGALRFFTEALNIFSSIDRPADRATVINNIGEAKDSLNQVEDALNDYVESFTILQSFAGHPTIPVVLSNMGHIFFLKGYASKALACYQPALEIFRALRRQSQEAGTLNNIGQAKALLRSDEEPLKDYQQSLAIYEELKDRPNQVKVIGNIATHYETLGRFSEALDTYERGIAILEGLRDSTAIDEIRAGLSESSAFAYKAARLLLTSGQSGRAFEIIESARARGILDRLGNIHQSRLKPLNSERMAGKLELDLKLKLLEKKLAAENDAITFVSLRSQYDSAQEQYEDLLLRHKLQHSDEASLRNIKPLHLREVRQLLKNHTTLVSYFVGPERTFIFVIDKNSFHAVQVSIKETELTNAIRWFRHFSNLRNSQTATLMKLYGWLIAPVRQYIKTRLVGIVPHRELNYVPFAALSNGKSYFGDDHGLFYLPSASVLPFIREKAVTDKILVLAQNWAVRLPWLKFADYEAEAVAAVYKTRALTTGRASKSDFLREAGNYNIVHVAAHADISSVSPLFYRILLAPSDNDNGAVELRDVYDLDLYETSLVVLSDCQTQLGAHKPGDDIVALNRAFISAGAATVIASLWKIDDKASADLMKSFYLHLKRGVSKAEALRQAQRETRKHYPNPYYWAAFVLTGDPGRERGRQSSTR